MPMRVEAFPIRVNILLRAGTWALVQLVRLVSVLSASSRVRGRLVICLWLPAACLSALLRTMIVLLLSSSRMLSLNLLVFRLSVNLNVGNAPLGV